MDLELRFDGLREDVVDAVLDVRLDDFAMADAGAAGPAARVADLHVSPSRPILRLSLDLPSGAGTYEPGLLVRLRGRTPDDERIEFFNTTATPVPAAATGPVHVVLTRIA